MSGRRQSATEYRHGLSRGQLKEKGAVKTEQKVEKVRVLQVTATTSNRSSVAVVGQQCSRPECGVQNCGACERGRERRRYLLMVHRMLVKASEPIC